MKAKTLLPLLLPLPLLVTIFTCIILMPAQLTAQTSSNPDFEIAPNGVTLTCDDADVGDTTDITFGSTTRTFTKRNRSQIEDLLNANENNPEIANTCTSGITDMSSLFEEKTGFNQNIGSWDVSSVTNMSSMFKGNRINSHAFNQNIGSWDVSRVRDMSVMFRRAEAFNQDIDDWDVSQVRDMSKMFSRALAFNQDIGSWDVSQVTDMSSMFSNGIAFNQDIGSWDVSRVRDMSEMFNNAVVFNQDIGGWDVSRVRDMSVMFQRASSFNQDIGGWDVSLVADMNRMFKFSVNSPFNQDLSNWCVLLITSEPVSFDDLSGLSAEQLPVWGTCPPLDVNNLITPADEATGVALTPEFKWQKAEQAITYDVRWANNEGFTFPSLVEGITDTTLIPETALTADTKIYWQVRGVEDFFTGEWSEPFSFITLNNNFFRAENGVTVICTDAEVGDTGKVDGVEYTKRSKDQITPDNAPTTCTSGITDMSNLFENAVSFNGDISIWDVSSVTNMSRMFQQASSFDRNLGDWDVSNVENFKGFLGDPESPTNDSPFLSYQNYDSLLIGWAQLDLKSDIVFDAPNAEFSEDAASARNTIIDNFNWTVNDGGMLERGTFAAGETNTVDFPGARVTVSILNRSNNAIALDVRDRPLVVTGNIETGVDTVFTDLAGWVINIASGQENPDFEATIDFSADGLGNAVDTEKLTIVKRADTTQAWQDVTSLETAVSFNASENILTVEGLDSFSEFALAQSETATANEEDISEIVPNEFELKQNFPNPFNPSTTIQYALPEQAQVNLTVYDMLGQQVATLLSGQVQSAGSHSVNFDASNLSSGMYIYRLQAGSQSITRKMILLK